MRSAIPVASSLASPTRTFAVEFGKAREMVVLGLARSKRTEAGDVLIGFLDDPVVSVHAVKALRKLKIQGARSGLEKMLGDDRAWVRREAQRALAALG